jgi:hypothetical protein
MADVGLLANEAAESLDTEIFGGLKETLKG